MVASDDEKGEDGCISQKKGFDVLTPQKTSVFLKAATAESRLRGTLKCYVPAKQQRQQQDVTRNNNRNNKSERKKGTGS